MSSKKLSHFESHILKGKLRRNGYERWRYFFAGVNKLTGEQRTFFIEMYYVNPQLSPKEPVIASKSRPKISANDLQYALAGTLSAQTVSQEQKVQPSYVMVKAGVYGKDGKQLNRFEPSSALTFNKSTGAFNVSEIIFGIDNLSGNITVSQQDLRDKPELLCSAGSISWDLRFEKLTNCSSLTNAKNNIWIPGGAKTVFAGLIHLDGQEFSVVPRSSSGYIEKSWGSQLPERFFHVSSSNLSSIISGKPLLKSCISIEGEYDGKLSIYLCNEGETFALSGNSFFNKYSEIHNCSQMPADADGEKLHWAISVTKKKYVIDIEFYCKTEEMFVKDYETPEGGKKLLKILSGGSGFGEIRIYKKVDKDLILVEQATSSDGLCEYGTIDEIEE